MSRVLIDRDEVLRLQEEGLTQEEAAKRLGVCVSTLRKWRRLNGVGWRGGRGKELARNRVNDQLRERDLTQMQVAADLGLHAPAISTLAAGRRVLLADGATFSGPPSASPTTYSSLLSGCGPTYRRTSVRIPTSLPGDSSSAPRMGRSLSTTCLPALRW